MTATKREEQTVWKRFKNRYEINPKTQCWEWKSGLNRKGYGCFFLNGKQMRAHRASLLLHGKELIQGLQVDHICRVRNCVNPAHLEQVTHKENQKRGLVFKTHCKRGHEQKGENLV